MEAVTIEVEAAMVVEGVTVCNGEVWTLALVVMVTDGVPVVTDDCAVV